MWLVLFLFIALKSLPVFLFLPGLSASHFQRKSQVKVFLIEMFFEKVRDQGVYKSGVGWEKLICVKLINPYYREHFSKPDLIIS